MVRTQISLTQEQMDALRAAAARDGVPIAEVVRQAVDAHLTKIDYGPRLEGMLRAVGVGRSGLGDLAEGHDRYAWEDD